MIGILTFIILEGQVFIKNHAFFDGWETIAVIILFAVPLISGTVCIKLLYNRLKAV
ncbi:YoqO family protein [Bacillus atrophaeus]|uniref:YoqO family protein n=1 Tax=Bacillus atrophaeus TaxID=1452 RepID=UPI0021D51DD1|nr:YoqO family protein [Bacillus atrophaeus]